MISICIPVYNFKVGKLVNALNQQGKDAGVPFEIIIIDDCSSPKFRKSNKTSCSKYTYILLDENIGRSRIRNLFLKYAKFTNLLFLDCDSVIISNMFLHKYIEEIHTPGFKVVCGGLVCYRNEPPRKFRLRWKYGSIRESCKHTIRNQDPFQYFKNSNFLIEVEILRKIKFDERIAGYGHEDTLFAYKLMKNEIRVKHIENPVLHACKETNSEFLEKTENSIFNLVEILNYVDYDKEFINHVKILKVSNQLSRMYLNIFVKISFIIFKSALKFLLRKGFGGLRALDFYKLGLLKKITPR